MPSLLNMDHSALFARSLKKYGDKQYKPNTMKATVATATMVIGFDMATFQKKCHPASPAYDDNLDFDIIAGELFKADEMWASRDALLEKAMNELAKLHGYHIGKNKRVIHCTRIGDTSTQRNYAGGALAAKCPFQVKLKPLCREAYKAKETSKGWTYRDLWNEPVQIISACCQHGGMCHPSRQNRVMTGQRSGKYVAQIPDNALFTLCNQYEKRGRLASAFIKDTLAPIWPSAKNITKYDCFNVRVKIIRLLPTFKKSNGDYEEFKAVANANDLLNGIDNLMYCLYLLCCSS